MLLPLHMNGLNLDSGTAVAVLTVDLAESTVIAGGEAIVITLTNDTWVGATFNAQRQNILDGITGTTFISSQGVGTVVRTSDTVVTITLSAVPGYTISGDEVGSVLVPSSALAGADDLDAGSFTVTDDIGGAKGGRVRRKRYVVEVDGEFFEVANIAAAESFLLSVRESAQEAAERDVKTVTPKPPKVRIRTIRGAPTTSRTLQREVARTQKAVTQAYARQAEKVRRQRAIDMEIAERMQQKIVQEEEENLIILLSI